jgi:hypothetical protein
MRPKKRILCQGIRARMPVPPKGFHVLQPHNQRFTIELMVFWVGVLPTDPVLEGACSNSHPPKGFHVFQPQSEVHCRINVGVGVVVCFSPWRWCHSLLLWYSILRPLTRFQHHFKPLFILGFLSLGFCVCQCEPCLCPTHIHYDIFRFYPFANIGASIHFFQSLFLPCTGFLIYYIFTHRGDCCHQGCL